MRIAFSLMAPLLVAFLAAPASSLPSPSAHARLITETDLLQFRWVADPQISPDGTQIAYVLVTVKDDGYETNLWTVSTSGKEAPRPLTFSGHDSAPRWSPDSRTLAFVRADQLYLLPMQGGEARQWTSLPHGASAAAWSPDGRTLAFTTTGGSQPEAPGAKKSDVRVITRAVFRLNGAGQANPDRHSHIWTIGATGSEPPTPRQLTSGRFDEKGPRWSRDGSRLFFVSDPVDEPYYQAPDANLYAVPAAGGKVTTVLDINGPVEQPVASPEGERIAFVGYVNPPQDQSYTQPSLYVSNQGHLSNLTGRFDVEIGSDAIGDQPSPRGGGSTPLVWSANGRSVYSCVTRAGRADLVKIDASTGKMENVTAGDHQLVAYTSTPDATRFAMTFSDATHIGDVYVLEAASRKLTQLTHVNAPLFRQLTLTEPEDFSFTTFDGQKIEGWIQKPPNFAPGLKYPMILQIHGGPDAAYGCTFTHEFQWMAAKGYVVVYLNPRGSTSYGQSFANSIQFHYPGADYRDLMLGVDEVLKRGYVDPQHLGVTGGSGGGLLTNWIITQTPRFQAAVSQRSIADWAGFWYSADFTLFRPNWFRHFPFQDPADYRARSPVTYVENVTISHALPSRVVPVLLEHARPIHEVVPVDVFLPGCPPSADLIFQTVTDLLAGRPPHPGINPRFGA